MGLDGWREVSWSHSTSKKVLSRVVESNQANRRSHFGLSGVGYRYYKRDSRLSCIRSCRSVMPTPPSVYVRPPKPQRLSSLHYLFDKH